jgi:hypothetical protein
VWLLLPDPEQRISRQPGFLTVPLLSIRSGSQMSSCGQEPTLIEGSEQGLKVRYFPDSCLAHSPYRTIAGRGRPLCRWRVPACGVRCTHSARARDKAGQELSDGGRGHGTGQTKQRGCGASDGLPTRQTGRDTVSAGKRTAPEVEATARAKGLTTSKWLAAVDEIVLLAATG